MRTKYNNNKRLLGHNAALVPTQLSKRDQSPSVIRVIPASKQNLRLVIDFDIY